MTYRIRYADGTWGRERSWAEVLYAVRFRITVARLGGHAAPPAHVWPEASYKALVGA